MPCYMMNISGIPVGPVSQTDVQSERVLDFSVRFLVITPAGTRSWAAIGVEKAPENDLRVS